jgi:magnesium transporter
MITIYKTIDAELQRIPEPISGCWMNVINPTPEEVAHIHSLGIPHDYITYPLDLDERARTERENSELLIVLRIPYFQGEASDIPYSTIPLGIILTSQHIITVCKLENEILQDFTTG